MSLYRKVELIEDDGMKEKINKTEEQFIPDSKAENISENSKINENLIKIIENIVDKYLETKNYKTSSVKNKKIIEPVKKVKKKKLSYNWYIPK